MKITICGAGGFIGENLVRHLSNDKKNEITAIFSRKNFIYRVDDNVKCIRANLLDPKHVSEYIQDCDLLLQMAATTSGSNVIVNSPYVHVTDNAIMNSLLLRETVNKKIGHFIFPSCSVMYPSSLEPQDENIDFNNPITDKYFGVGNTKLYIEKMCKFYSTVSNTKFTVIRHTNVYGPYDKFDPAVSHVFAALMRKIVEAKDSIEIWGDGEEGRDLLYIDDLIDFIEKAVQKQENKYELFNVGSGELVKIKNLATTIMNVLDKQLNIEYNSSKPTIPVNITLDYSKAKSLVAWEPKTSLATGIEKTHNWYKENIKDKCQ